MFRRFAASLLIACALALPSAARADLTRTALFMALEEDRPEVQKAVKLLAEAGFFSRLEAQAGAPSGGNTDRGDLVARVEEAATKVMYEKYPIYTKVSKELRRVDPLSEGSHIWRAEFFVKRYGNFSKNAGIAMLQRQGHKEYVRVDTRTMRGYVED